MTPHDFEQAHSAQWRDLEKMVQQRDRDLQPARFVELYRLCCEHLALAEAREFPVHIIERLARVTAHAHQIVYRRQELGLRRIARVLYGDFPRQVRRDRWYVLAAALLFLVPTLAMGVAVYFRPDLVLSVVGEDTVRQFEGMYGPGVESIGRLRDASTDWNMFGFYIMNNVGIAFQCFASGVVFTLGSVYFLIFNGIYGGAIGGYVTAQGYGNNFYPFVATHSAFELTAIVLSGAAGLRVGVAVLLPGRLSRAAALQQAAGECSSVVFGVAIMLLIAAVLEAFWSSATWVAAPAKYTCAAVCWGLVLLFFLRRPDAA
jgi:uncharacterized membrane protein SpoIIM required for sporulation